MHGCCYLILYLELFKLAIYSMGNGAATGGSHTMAGMEL
jgi:hypothetical protein